MYKRQEPIVCSTEADMDAALTMEIFKKLAKTPVLFADVRHWHDDYKILDLCNSGEHATYFAGASFDYRDNLPRVSLLPESFYFQAGGAAVHHPVSYTHLDVYKRQKFNINR